MMACGLRPCGQQWLFFWSFGRMLDKVRETVDQLRQSALGTIKGILDPALVAKAQAMLGVSGETVEGAATGPVTVKDASGATAEKPAPQPEPWTPTRIAMLTVKIFFAFVFASFATNELMFEPKSIRVLVFFLVLWLIYSVDVMWMVLLSLYLIRAMWVKYYNRRWEIKAPKPTELIEPVKPKNLTDTDAQAKYKAALADYQAQIPKYEADLATYKAEEERYELNRKHYIPRIFAFLPLTTVEGTTRIARFFKYPFYYPKTDIKEKWLNVEQYKYENELKESMFNWDAMLAIGKIKEDFEEFHKELTELNRRVRAPVPSAANSTDISGAAQKSESEGSGTLVTQSRRTAVTKAAADAKAAAEAKAAIESQAAPQAATAPQASSEAMAAAMTATSTQSSNSKEKPGILDRIKSMNPLRRSKAAISTLPSPSAPSAAVSASAPESKGGQ